MRDPIAFVLVAVLMQGSTAITAENGNTVLRLEHSDLKSLVQQGVGGSATFRDLVSGLSDSSLLVYVRFERCTGHVPSCLEMGAGTATRRVVIIRLDPFGHGKDELVALLAHELQHASEIAAVPSVVDTASLRRMYTEMGWKGQDGFETAGAIKVTRAVRNELSARK
jgi:hypothetical protein